MNTRLMNRGDVVLKQHVNLLLKAKFIFVWILGLSLYSGSVNAEIIERTYLNHYFVTPKEGQSVKDAIRENSTIVRDGRTFLGQTTWEVTPLYKYGGTGYSCKIKEMQIYLNIKFILPKIHELDPLPEEKEKAFEFFYNAIYQHELGHKKLGVSCAQEIETFLNEHPPYGTCAELQREVALNVSRIKEKYQDLNRQYDIETDHGRTQGAVSR